MRLRRRYALRDTERVILRRRSLVCLLTFALLLPLAARAQNKPAHTLRIAAAADLTPVLPYLADAYEKQTGVHLVPSFASSAALTDQIRNGAPFDVFLSADTLHPLQLVQGGQALSPAPVPYARGVLVLWARKDCPLQPLTLQSLENPALQHLAIANPAHAPYGLAAQQFLEHAHLLARLQPRLAIAENISQAAQFAESGNAQAGLISLTTANTPHFRDTGTFVLVPAEDYAPLVQAGVTLKATHDPRAAQAFLDWLTSPAIQDRLHDYGLHPAH